MKGGVEEELRHQKEREHAEQHEEELQESWADPGVHLCSGLENRHQLTPTEGTSPSETTVKRRPRLHHRGRPDRDAASGNPNLL